MNDIHIRDPSFKERLIIDQLGSEYLTMCGDWVKKADLCIRQAGIYPTCTGCILKEFAVKAEIAEML